MRETQRRKSRTDWGKGGQGLRAEKSTEKAAEQQTKKWGTKGEGAVSRLPRGRKSRQAEGREVAEQGTLEPRDFALFFYK